MKRRNLTIHIDELESGLWAVAVDNGRIVGLEIDPPFEGIRWGAVYRAKVKTVDTRLNAVWLDLDGMNTGLMFLGDARTKKGEKPQVDSIAKLFSAGDMVNVQVKVDAFGEAGDSERFNDSKFPRLSMDITLPGRYLIYSPILQENKVSRRVTDKQTRGQMLEMLSEMEDIQGCILRAAAQHTQTAILTREGRFLKELWDAMQPYLDGSTPALIMDGPNALKRILSDHAGDTIDRIEVVILEHLTVAEEWCSAFAPDLMTKIEPVELADATEDLSLIDDRDLLGQIEDLSDAYAVLPDGANLIIQETAALTAIDVNRGASRAPSHEINRQAAIEVARQIRLRNLGGIIIVDFLKVKGDGKAEKIFLDTLRNETGEDPCTVQVHGLTRLGLVELTRNRRTAPLRERMDKVMEIEV